MFFGYKIFRVTLFFAGLVGAGLPLFSVLLGTISGSSAIWIALAVALAVGIIAGALGAFFPRLGTALLGIALGLGIALILNITVLGQLSLLIHIPANITFYVVAALLGAIFGAFSAYAVRLTAITVTSLLRAYGLCRGFANVAFPGTLPSELNLEQLIANGGTIPWQVYPYAGAWVVLFIAGMIVQVKYTGKTRAKGDTSEWNEELFQISKKGRKSKKSKRSSSRRRDSEKQSSKSRSSSSSKKAAQYASKSKNQQQTSLLDDYEEENGNYEEEYNDDSYYRDEEDPEAYEDDSYKAVQMSELPKTQKKTFSW